MLQILFTEYGVPWKSLKRRDASLLLNLTLWVQDCTLTDLCDSLTGRRLMARAYGGTFLNSLAEAKLNNAGKWEKLAHTVRNTL